MSLFDRTFHSESDKVIDLVIEKTLDLWKREFSMGLTHSEYERMADRLRDVLSVKIEVL
jgi:hypothetical protein